jgi:hypothetical protein
MLLSQLTFQPELGRITDRQLWASMKPTFTFPHLTNLSLTQEQPDSSGLAPFARRTASDPGAQGATLTLRPNVSSPPPPSSATFSDDQTVAEDLTAMFSGDGAGAPPLCRTAPFAAWLFRIAHDRVMDYHRRQLADPVPLSESCPTMRLTQRCKLPTRLKHIACWRPSYLRTAHRSQLVS